MNSLDSVGSGELHEDEDSDSDEDAFAVSGVAKLFPLGQHATACTIFSVVVDGRHNVGQLFMEVGVVFGELSELDEYLAGGITGFELGEPSGDTRSVVGHDIIHPSIAYLGDSGTKIMPITSRPPGTSWIAKGKIHCEEVSAMFCLTP